MAYESISIDYELKQKMETMKGERSWNEFFLSLLKEAEDGREKREIPDN